MFRPYDLITVPKVKKNPEHYIFSVFGGLHVVPGIEENEQFTLDEWNRHAMIWQACSNIKFFREFLRKKFLHRWIKNAKFSRFIKLKKSVSTNILHTIPEYGQALLLVSKLIQEINTIVFLPKDKVINFFTNLQDKQTKNNNNNTQRILDAYKQKQQIIKETFTLQKYSYAIYDLTKRSKEILKYFFVYVKYILDHTRVKLYDKIRFYEKLINSENNALSKNDVTKSMSVQKNLGILRSRELEKTNHQIGMLGNFTDLVGTFIGSNMLKICRIEKENFLQDFKECLSEKREPLFEAELGFDDDNVLCMLPNREKFVREVMNSVRKIKSDMMEASRIIDFEGALRDVEKYGFNVKETKEKVGETEDHKEDDEDVLRETDPVAYYEFLLNQDVKDKKLSIEKPVLNMVKDYDESVLDNRLVLPFVESKLKIDHYILKAQANPLRPISFTGMLINE